MSQRQLHDQIRRAFSALTRPPRPLLTERIRDSLWARQVAAAGGGRRLPVPPAALIAAILVVLLAAAGVLEGPAVVRTVARAGSEVSRALTPPRSASTPRATPSTTPASTPTSTAVPSGTPSAAPSPSATPSAPPTAPPAAGPPPATLPGFSCAYQYGGGPGQATMTTTRVGVQTGYDRFVIQFDGPVPRFEVTPQDSAAFAQSGGPVTLQGAAGLAVVLRDASGPAYAGPTDLRPGFSAIREARLLSDSQGVVAWGIGLARAACFHAWALDSPSRLVIDIASADP